MHTGRCRNSDDRLQTALILASLGIGKIEDDFYQLRTNQLMRAVSLVHKSS